MNLASAAAAADVDVLVVGAGITGIYQLYRAREAASPRCWSRPATASAAPGTGTATRAPASTPRATRTATCSPRSCSTSGSGRSTSPPSPRPSATSTTSSTGSTCAATCASARAVTSAVWDEPSGTWTVTIGDGAAIRAAVPRRRDRRAVGAVPPRRARAATTSAASSTTPGRWPAEPVDFAGKRVAVVGTSSSGVQVVPTILDDVASLTVYQRTANWCTPLNNRPITAEEQARAAGRLRGAPRDARTRRSAASPTR